MLMAATSSIHFFPDGPLADVHVVEDKPNDRTPSGLWPSDHAGVFATVRLPKAKSREARNEPARQEH